MPVRHLDLAKSTACGAAIHAGPQLDRPDDARRESSDVTTARVVLSTRERVETCLDCGRGIAIADALSPHKEAMILPRGDVMQQCWKSTVKGPMLTIIEDQVGRRFSAWRGYYSNIKNRGMCERTDCG
ncbi:MAG TPA: hypothetical protein VEZ88_13120 [Steroidobacteraceae bacterium]|nr:hypothetical protein [Steroidobacteraceae bacterium]